MLTSNRRDQLNQLKMSNQIKQPRSISDDRCSFYPFAKMSKAIPPTIRHRFLAKNLSQSEAMRRRRKELDSVFAYESFYR